RTRSYVRARNGSRRERVGRGDCRLGSGECLQVSLQLLGVRRIRRHVEVLLVFALSVGDLAGLFEGDPEREVKAWFPRSERNRFLELGNGRLVVAFLVQGQREVVLSGVVVREQPGRCAVLVDGLIPLAALA